MSDDPVLRFHKKPVQAIAISTAGDLFATGGDDALVAVWDLSSCSLISTFRPPSYRWAVTALAFSRDDHRVIAIYEGKKGAARGHVLPRIWDLRSGKTIRVGREVDKFVDGFYGICVGGPDDQAYLVGDVISHVDMATGDIRGKWSIGDLKAASSAALVALAAGDRRRLVTGHYDGTLALWNDASPKSPNTFEVLHKSDRPIWGVASLKRGGSPLLAWFGPAGLNILDLVTMEPTCLSGGSTEILRLSIGEEGQCLTTLDMDGALKRWSIAPGKETCRDSVGKYASPSALAPQESEGRLIIGHGMGKIRLQPVETAFAVP